MLSVDTNILLPAVDEENERHEPAATFLDSLQHRDDIGISEFILLELYCLLRNPAAVRKPLGASEAVDVCEAFRAHSHWQLFGFPSGSSRAFHDQLWRPLRGKDFARRRAYDVRTALSLMEYGVTEFATVNVKDFSGLGFEKVWNPLPA